MKQANETEAAFQSRTARAQAIVDRAPDSPTGWVVEPDGVTVTPAAANEDPRVVHRTRHDLVETISWGLFVEADRARLAAERRAGA